MVFSDSMIVFYLIYNNIINNKTIIGSLMNPTKKFLFSSIFFSALISSPAFANNLTISNLNIKSLNPSTNTIVLRFDVSWENSWRTKINHDAVWLTARLHNPTVSPTDKKLCQLSASGSNPTGTSTGSNISLEVYVPADKLGAFIRPAAYGNTSSVSSTGVEVSVKYDSCGFDDSDSVVATMMGIEMVYVPEGSFYAGDHAASVASFVQGSSDNDPWLIASESSISVSNPVSNGYRYVSSGQGDENATGSSFTIPLVFPKGFAGFYAMKYEITEGQWVEFLNSLPSQSARANRDLTNASHKNSDAVQYRNTISCSGSPLICSTSRPARSVSYLSWMDLAAFLDWAALRPMTELEYEKAARGPILPVAGEFAWGTTAATAASTISGSSEDGSETITTSDANAHFNSATLSGGDSANGAEYQQGPLRVGVFAGMSTSREESGATYYGVMDLSGNVSERTVTVGNSTGRSFAGTHGDGVLSTDSGYEGNADESDWPGMDVIVTRGVTGGLGSGFKGGSWNAVSDRLRISDRQNAATTDVGIYNTAGGRGVRTYDGE